MTEFDQKYRSVLEDNDFYQRELKKSKALIKMLQKELSDALAKIAKQRAKIFEYQSLEVQFMAKNMETKGKLSLYDND